jgi:hypothetical protein
MSWVISQLQDAHSENLSGSVRNDNYGAFPGTFLDLFGIFVGSTWCGPVVILEFNRMLLAIIPVSCREHLVVIVLATFFRCKKGLSFSMVGTE